MRPSRTRSCQRAEARLAAALLALTFFACVGRGTYNEVVQERDQLSAELARAKVTTQSLDRERVALMEQLEDLRQKRTTLESNVEHLRRTEAELSAALKKSESELAERNEELAKLRGTYTDLVAELEAEVASGQIQIEQLREGLRLNVAQDILFASGSTQLNAGGREVLQKVAAQLKKLPHRVEVQGHTDDVPVKPNSRFPSNWELAGERAAQVVRLFASEGVDPTRMRAVSFGEFHPVASNDTPEGRLKNRRIEIRLEPVRDADPAQGSGEAGT